MVAFSASALLLTLRVLLSVTPSTAAPVAQAGAPAAGATGYWLADPALHTGKAPFNKDTAYKVFRNVADYGAKGDGTTDDTAAINSAISEGNRCGEKCDSSTTTPAMVYFPPGTYLVSKPIIQYYYTQFIGDAKQMPTLKASASFEGMGVIDADPYIPGGNGANWYTNQNNFYRQIRNMRIDIKDAKATSGVHWQVSQATSIQNVVFDMAEGDAGKDQKGIFQDNGSGGFMTDLVFNGGGVGAFLGSQQFTTRNMTFNGCGTGIYMNWNWLWTMKSNTFNNCKVGMDMANAPQNQTVGSVIMMDSKFVGTPIGVNSSFSDKSIPTTGGSLILDNVDFAGSETGVMALGQSVLAGGKTVASWAQGHALAAGGTVGRIQGDSSNAPQKPSSLLGDNGFFERSKPQYEDVAASSFVSLLTAGAKGDGTSDDTEAIQKAIDGLQDGQILYAPHGAYLVTKTITIPAAKNVKFVGEIWPMFLATGEAFSNQDEPVPVFKIGEASGDKGTFEMSDIIVSTQGAAPGAILMEWNINAENGAAGLWDVHFRVAGFAGTNLQSDKCKKSPETTHPANEECIGSFMQLHITKSANGYFENVWLWTADHELDLGDHSQIDIYNGRGMLVESQGPVWLYGTASEHSVLSQYHFQGAKDIFFGAIQTETPYYQPNPDFTTPFKTNAKYFDPDFTTKSDKTAWAVRIIDSSSIWNYGAGTYSFFQNYGQECVNSQDCQTDINQIENSTNVNIFGLSTKASVNMITSGGKGLALDSDNRSNFCATLAIFAQT
ncbi:glycoside hydrolase family 55 protein [Lentithecium fluviatile CBS 122367]|uniref:Glycoside hydrolase family 55 protein n=1 Tax=Lentithecium fluviatile CBS 122367 TaxID=1168545 RepID=A0A6G1IJL1_9PLEO|nr:glycoside hydrolase family 55 protein [Lentithecium fluviatile CBS 122367]